MDGVGSKEDFFVIVLIRSDYYVIWSLITAMAQVSASGYKLVPADVAHWKILLFIHLLERYT